jgi:hypothetical protein
MAFSRGFIGFSLLPLLRHVGHCAREGGFDELLHAGAKFRIPEDLGGELFSERWVVRLRVEMSEVLVWRSMRVARRLLGMRLL